jgi:hypothetical protein
MLGFASNRGRGGHSPQSPTSIPTKDSPTSHPSTTPPIKKTKPKNTRTPCSEKQKKNQTPKSKKPKKTQTKKCKKTVSTLYSNLPASINISGTEHSFASTSASVSLSPKLEENKNLSLAPNQHFKINGNLETKISLSFFAAKNANFTAAEQVLSVLTGDVSGTIYIGGTSFSSCYLENLSVEIVPFAPVMMSADFICLKTARGPGLSSYGFVQNPESGICYGHNVTTISGESLTNTKESLSYKVSCNRTPVYTIGSDDATSCFLDSVSKEISIKSDNIKQFINYASYGDILSVSLNTEDSQLLHQISFSNNSKITAQNLSINAEDVLAGQVTLREIVL